MKTRMTELPLTVAVVASTDYVDDLPENNALDCRLIVGRPDLAVTDVNIVPNVKPDFIRAPDIVHPEVQVQAFVTVKNCGTGRLPSNSAKLRWSGSIEFGSSASMEAYAARSLDLRRGEATSEVDLPSLRAGEWCVVRLEQTASDLALLAQPLLLQQALLVLTELRRHGVEGPGQIAHLVP